MLTLHHLGLSQSERILWLLEELELPYKLTKHTRAPLAAPESLKSVPGNHTGKAPFLIDDDNDKDPTITLSESGAIFEYILTKYDHNHQFSLFPSDPEYASYLHWLHFGNGSLQPAMLNGTFMDLAQISHDNPIYQLTYQRAYDMIKVLNDRLADNKWLAGSKFTAADVMAVYSLSTQRYWGPQLSYKGYPNVIRYLEECAARPAYRRALERGEPEMEPLIGAEPAEMGLFADGGVESSIWRKKK